MEGKETVTCPDCRADVSRVCIESTGAFKELAHPAPVIDVVDAEQQQQPEQEEAVEEEDDEGGEEEGDDAFQPPRGLGHVSAGPNVSTRAAAGAAMLAGVGAGGMGRAAPPDPPVPSGGAVRGGAPRSLAAPA